MRKSVYPSRASSSSIRRISPAGITSRHVSGPRGRCSSGWVASKRGRRGSGNRSINGQLSHALARGQTPPSYRGPLECPPGVDHDRAEAWRRRKNSPLEGRGSEAVSSCRQALAPHEELTREQPGSEHARRWLAMVHVRSANASRDHCPSEAAASYRRALELLEPISPERPADPGIQEELGLFLLFGRRSSKTAWTGGPEAIGDYHRAIAVFESSNAHGRTIAASRSPLATSYHVLGRLMVNTGHPAEGHRALPRHHRVAGGDQTAPTRITSAGIAIAQAPGIG